MIINRVHQRGNLVEKHNQKHALVVTSVSKSFGGIQAVNSVNLVVPIGERRALIGPNGAGKTTLFNLINGELTVDKGQIKIFDVDITKKPVHERARLGLGRTYQISQLFLNMTVEENLFLAGATNIRMEFDLIRPWRKCMEIYALAREVAEQVELTPYLDKKVSDLSYGLQRQLELGMAISMKPRLIMLDEPTAGLSPAERVDMVDLIKKLQRDVTLVLIEHNIEIVLDIADRITVLNRGYVVAEGTPAEIKSNIEVQNVYLGRSYA